VKIEDIADPSTASLISMVQGNGLEIDVTDLVISPDGSKAALAIDAPVVNIPPPMELLPDAVVIVDISILSDLPDLVRNNTLDEDQASKFTTEYVELPVGSNPLYLTFSPTGGHLLVSNNGSDTITVIDANAGTVTGTVDVSSVGIGPREIAFRREGTAPAIFDHAIVVLDEDTVGGVGGITRFNLTDFIATGTPPTLALIAGLDANPLAIDTLVSQDVVSGIYAYVTNSGASNVSVFNLDTDTFLGAFGVGAAPVDVDLSPENPIAFFACRNSNELWGADYSLFVNAPNPLFAYPGLSMLNQPVKIVVQIRP
jgi:YVTN family beta-propeller protein